jgi:hypothetical protein
VKELLVRPYGTLAVPFRGAQLTEWPWLGILLVEVSRCCSSGPPGTGAAAVAGLLVAGALGLWVLVSIAPVYSMFDVSGTLQGSRYVYLAAAGWSILMAALLLPARSRLDLFLVVAACGIGVVGVRLNLVPWTRAAAMRDEVLSAVERARASGCNDVWIATCLTPCRARMCSAMGWRKRLRRPRCPPQPRRRAGSACRFGRGIDAVEIAIRIAADPLHRQTARRRRVAPETPRRD